MLCLEGGRHKDELSVSAILFGKPKLPLLLDLLQGSTVAWNWVPLWKILFEEKDIGDDKAHHSDSMASFCQRLPPELWLHIVSYLSILDIHAFQRISKLFNTLISLNESLIYKAAAIHHGFAPAVVPDLQTVTTHRKRKFDWLSGVKTWLHYCAFASLDVLHLFIHAPRQAACGH